MLKTKKEWIINAITSALEGKMVPTAFNGTNNILSSFMPNAVGADTVAVDLGDGITLSLVTGQNNTLAAKADFLEAQLVGAPVAAMTAKLKLKIAFNGTNDMDIVYIDLKNLVHKIPTGLNPNSNPVGGAYTVNDITNATPLQLNTNATDPDKSSILGKMVSGKTVDILEALVAFIQSGKNLSTENYTDPSIKTAYTDYLTTEQWNKLEQTNKSIIALRAENELAFKDNIEAINTSAGDIRTNTTAIKDSTSAIKEIKTDTKSIDTETKALNSSYVNYAVYAIAIMAVVSLGLSSYQMMNKGIDSSVKSFDNSDMDLHTDI